MDTPSNSVVVRAFWFPLEASVALSTLQAAGIPAWIADDHIVAMDWLLSNAVGGIKILVRAEDLAAARELLDAPAVVTAEAEAEALGDVDDPREA